MGTPSGPAPTLPALARPRLTIPTLTIPTNVTLPLRQDVPLPDLPWPRVTEAIRASLASAGFEILAIHEDVGAASGGPSGGYPRRSETLAERRRRSVSMPAPVRVSVYVLFGAGLGLGIFDAVAVGVALVGLAWAGGAAVVAALFWLRYGRSFQSEVAVVVLRPGRSSAGAATVGDPGAHHIAWFAGGVRSDVRGSHRTAVEVAVPPGLARDAGALARDFAQRLTAATSN
jgi:hypothetical protein